MSTTVERDSRTIITEILNVEFGGVKAFLMGLINGHTFEVMGHYKELLEELSAQSGLAPSTLNYIIDIVARIPIESDEDRAILVNDLLTNPAVQTQYCFFPAARNVDHRKVAKILPAVVEAVFKKKQARVRRNA